MIKKEEARQVIESREYLFCVAYYPYKYPDYRSPEDFIVLGKSRDKAFKYARDKWGKPDKILFYPKNYIRDARQLIEEGLYC